MAKNFTKPHGYKLSQLLAMNSDQSLSCRSAGADALGLMTNEGQDVTPHRIALFQKSAFPFQLFIMVFLGLALSSSHSRKGMAAESLALSCLLAILFWILNQILLALGDAGELHPFSASWGSIVLFGLISWVLHLRYRV